MPPLFIFRCRRMKAKLMINAPSGYWAECHKSDWIQKDIFTSWFQKFILVSRAPCWWRNIKVIQWILTFSRMRKWSATPMHCTHCLQLVHVGFVKPLSTYYSKAAQDYLTMNSGRLITQFQMAAMICQQVLMLFMLEKFSVWIVIYSQRLTF